MCYNIALFRPLFMCYFIALFKTFILVLLYIIIKHIFTKTNSSSKTSSMKKMREPCKRANTRVLSKFTV